MLLFISPKKCFKYKRFQSPRYLQRIKDKGLIRNAVAAKPNGYKVFMGTGNTCRATLNSDGLAKAIFVTSLKNHLNISAQTPTVMKLFSHISKTKIIPVNQ